MKLFNAIAAAAVIGGSLITARPAMAEGWKYVTSNQAGSKIYMRNSQCAGPVCEVEKVYVDGDSGDDLVYLTQINCNTWMDRWKYKYPDQAPKWHESKKYQWITNFRVMGPSTVNSAVAEKVCR